MPKKKKIPKPKGGGPWWKGIGWGAVATAVTAAIIKVIETVREPTCVLESSQFDEARNVYKCTYRCDKPTPRTVKVERAAADGACAATM